MKRALALCVVMVAAIAATGVAAGSALAAGPSGTTKLQYVGRTSLAGAGGATSDPTGSSLSTETTGAQVDENVPNSGNSAARVPSSGVPTPPGLGITPSGSELLTSVAGLNHFNERTAGTGAYANTNFSLEPPEIGRAHV